MKFIKVEVWDKHYQKENIWENTKPTSYAKDFKKFLKKEDRVLEIGFGKGNDLIYLAKSGFDCYGIEISKVAVDKVKARAKNLHLIYGKAEKMPFKEEFFDAVYCVQTLYHLDEEKAIPEMIRILKSEGTLYLSFVTSMILTKVDKKLEGVYEEKVKKLVKNLEIVKEEPFIKEGKSDISTGLILVLKKK